MNVTVPWLDRWFAFHLSRGWRGFHRLWPLRGQQTLRYRCRYGPVFDLNPTEYIDQIVIREGYYESEVLEALRPWFGPGCVFWDVGANFGLHTITAAALHPGLRTYAFEPAPAAAHRLRAHAALNEAPVTTFEVALGEKEGVAKLYVNGSGNSGMSTLTNSQVGPAINVALRRADAVVHEHPQSTPTVMKLDVEGAEAAVLRGFGDLILERTLRAVVFESDPRAADEPGRCPAASLLVDAGFVLNSLSRRESTSHLLGNIIAMRP